MASAAQSLRLGCRSCRSQRPIRHVTPRVFVAWKSVSGGAIKDVKITEQVRPSPFDAMAEELDQLRAESRTMNFKKAVHKASQNLSPEEFAEFERHQDQILSASRDIDKLVPRFKNSLFNFRQPVRAKRGSFWFEDESDTDMIYEEGGADTDFNEDDITSMAHGKLDEHREHREYARLAIWEMPLLSKFAKPFEPPTQDMPLRFRYTSYMGEFHPAEKKVVVEFCAADLGLTPVQEMKMKKLVGPRYNPETEVIRMSCEMFEHQAQNKRYLSDLVDKLIVEAKDPKDTFEDIPLDTRHHPIQIKPKFPKEWRMTEERRKELEAVRQQALQLDESKKAEGTLIDGQERIKQALAAPTTKEKVAELVSAHSHKGPHRQRAVRR